MRRARVRAVAAGAVIALAASLAAACGSDSGAASEGGTSASASSDSASAGSDSSGSSSAGSGSATDGGTSGSASGNASGGATPSGDMHVTIPIAAGWDEDVAITHLWKYVLEGQGYTVETPTLDIGPIFIGVAKGDYDLFFDVALPDTHADYWKKYGDQMVDFGSLYDNVTLDITVPDYMDIDSIEDLPSVADKLGKTITGIDAGAGETRIVKTKMMPAYGLEKAGWTLKTSSTPAMLSALRGAIAKKEPIVVTLWSPHWAYSAFDLKILKDPKGAMGKPNQEHAVGSKKFVKEHPELVDAMKKFHLTEDQLGSLEAGTVQKPDATPEDIDAGIKAWAKDHQEFVDGMLG